MSGAESGGVSTNKKAWNCVFEARLYKLAVVFDKTHSLQVYYRKGKSGFRDKKKVIYILLYIYYKLAL